MTRSYFDPVAGVLSTEIFSAPEIYARELHAIFRRQWLFVGPERWVARPGDFLTTSMGADEIVVWRGLDGRRRAFRNFCARSNLALFSDVRGNAGHVRCACHGWVYASDGRDSSANLTEIPGLVSRSGLLFACADPGAGPFEDQLGDFIWWFGLLFGEDRPREIYGETVMRWNLDANWKLPVEAGCSACFQGATVLGQGIAGQMKTAGGLQILTQGGAIVALDPESAHRKADVALVPIGGCMFPNLTVDCRTHSLHVWQPRGPLKTEVNTYCLVDSAASAEDKEVARRSCQFHVGPAGVRMGELVPPWRAITRASLGVNARRYPLNLQMGLGRTMRRNVPGVIAEFASEHNQRGFYQWWDAQMRMPSPGLTAMPPSRSDQI